MYQHGAEILPSGAQENSRNESSGTDTPAWSGASADSQCLQTNPLWLLEFHPKYPIQFLHKNPQNNPATGQGRED